jgi:hypothetical protein
VKSKFRLSYLLWFLALGLVASCAYERRSTFLYPVTNTSIATPPNQPSFLWSVTISSAQIPPRKPSGLSWDDDNSPPDPFVILYVDDRLVWESAVVENMLTPTWNSVLPRNVAIKRDSSLRIEIWDRDTPPASDPIGRIQRIGLPSTAQPNAVARLITDTGAILSITVAPPKYHKGVGVTWFEERPSALVVLEVEQYSPAGRAGLRSGDRIVAINGQSVESLGDSQAASLFSLAAERSYELQIIDNKDKRRAVTLDRGFVWLTM